MKNKFPDDALNTDGLPEHMQAHAKQGKIKLLDVVALTQDVPKHNLKRGEVGTVVEILSNGEAFEVEFSDDNGQMYKCLGILASQLRVIHDEPINVNPNRQANYTLQGYYYQLCHTVNSWLDLADNDILYLEVAEDFDIESDGTFTATQVKHTQDNITLRSQQVIDGINNYWELRTNNPDRRVKFRLLTKSKIVKEQGNPLGMDKPGLEVWQLCSGNEAAIKKISEFLLTDGKISVEVTDFLKNASLQETYEQLIKPIAWETNSKPASFVEQSINEKLVLHGNRQPIPIPPSHAKKVVNRLLKEALTVASQKENRELTKVRFLEIFEGQVTQRIPTQHLQHLQMRSTMMGNVDPAFIEGLSDITIQSQSPIQDRLPPLYRDVFQRTNLLTNIQAKLQSEGIVVIQGGVDKGKTTLAKLTANDIRGSWFWLKLTDRKPSEIAQLLQQLAVAVSNASAQVNVILDDLNLQPQEVRVYKEDLGIVVYRAQERGAKLLITGQHKPPGDLIRSLGVSPSVVVNVSNFTIPEIEQFAQQLGCPTDLARTQARWIQAHTGGHPRLVHARLARLRDENWQQPDVIESILQTPTEVVKEREASRQLLADLPENHKEFLYRLSLLTEFREDYMLNIGEIPKSIPHPGDVFSQLIGPWIDRVDEKYYTISPLLTNAAKEVWSDDKIKGLHAHIANAILKTKELTTTEAWAVFTHSMAGQNKEGIIAFIYSLMNAPQNDWKKICQEFSLLAHIKIDPPKELFPGDAFVNQMFRSLQYRIAVEVEPECAPKILEIWDKETKPYEPHQSYLLSRLMLASQVLRYNQVPLPAKKLVGYIKEMIDIRDSNKDAWDMYLNSMEQIEEHITDKSNFFSFLFSFIYTRASIYAPFLSDFIDALDGLQPKTRTLLLADFEDDNIESRLLIDGVWWAEANRENPDWTRCLQVFDKVIERAIVWDHPHIAAASARGKAIIHDEYLDDPDTAHKVLQDTASKVGPLPVIEEEQALVYLHQERYEDALNIYERLLPEWNPPSEQLNLGPVEEYRRTAICAASLNEWEKAAIFLEEGAKRTQRIENTERYIGLYIDAGFAQFKAGNMRECIRLLNLALRKFEMLPQDNTDLKYFTLKKCLGHTIGWLEWHVSGNYNFEFEEPPIGFCSNPETDERFLDLPDSPIEHAWLNLAKIEYKFENGTTVLEHALQIIDQDTDPISSFLLSVLRTRYDLRNKTIDNLPQRIHQLVRGRHSIQKHSHSGKEIGKERIDSLPIADLPDLASVGNITAILVSALLTQLSTNRDIPEILTIWRANSSELPIKESMTSALDMMEAILLGEQSPALTVMKTQDAKGEERLVAALKVIENMETSLENLFYAHAFITSSLFDRTWLDSVVVDFTEVLSAQWFEKIESGAMWQINKNIVQQIELACNSSETGKKKIGQILLAAYPVVSAIVAPKTLQQFRSWTEQESEQKQEPTTGKNPTAQRLITAMEKSPRLTDEDVEALQQSIEEGKIPIKFDSPFEPDEREKE